uniref:Putative secreted peptide n=1 Tax=Anopheles braziliensis TaxID=58242 RepID=A0A2M3ZST1_9DIPT
MLWLWLMRNVMYSRMSFCSDSLLVHASRLIFVYGNPLVNSSICVRIVAITFSQDGKCSLIRCRNDAIVSP